MKAWATLLCIDDNPELLKVEQILFETHGYRVLTSTSGREGLRFFATQHIDAVILDFDMPDLDGEAVAAEMKRTKPHIPILIHSGYPLIPDGVLRIVDGYVVKGTSYSVLAGKVERLLLHGKSGGRPSTAPYA